FAAGVVPADGALWAGDLKLTCRACRVAPGVQRWLIETQEVRHEIPGFADSLRDAAGRRRGRAVGSADSDPAGRPLGGGACCNQFVALSRRSGAAWPRR